MCAVQQSVLDGVQYLPQREFDVSREGGPDRVILREAARAAGVSHSAAYRHFTDREALLAEVSRHARHELAAGNLGAGPAVWVK
jgi:hypothetical protein